MLEPATGDETGELPLGLAGDDAVGVDPAGPVSVTGHTVVETAMVEVTTVVESAGQLVTVGAQLVIVISLVVYTVDVVHLGGELAPGVEPPTGEVAAGTEGEGTPGTVEPTGLEAVGMEAEGTEAIEDEEPVAAGGVGRAEVVPGVQSKPTLQIPKSQLSWSLWSGNSKETEVAPPHWSLVTVVPEDEQEAVLRQEEPSGMP